MVVKVLAAVLLIGVMGGIATMWWYLWRKLSKPSHSQIHCQNADDEKTNDNPFGVGSRIRIRTHHRGRREVKIIGTSGESFLVDYGNGRVFRRKPETLIRLMAD